jgi:AcrR family transcriptional regulator
MPYRRAGPSANPVKERRSRGSSMEPAGPKGSKLKKKASQRFDSVAEDAPKSREAILSAALQTFARFGYDGASMPQIAKLAQVAPPLIHYYFGSKEKLWQETIEHSLGKLCREVAAIHKATRALAPLDRLRAILQAHAHFAAHWPDHFFMIIAEARSHGERYAWVQENYTGVLFDDVVTIMADARDKGQIRDVNIEQVALMLIGGLLIYFTVYPSRPKDKSVDELADEYTDMMFKLIYDGVVIRE